MADVIISIVARRVAAIIEDQIRYQVNLVRGAEKEIVDLSDKLKTIKNVLDDAEKRGVNEQSVKNWLRKLERTAYEMDDVLDEWNYALLNHNIKQRRRSQQKVCCSFNFIPSSSCSSLNMKVVVRRHTAKKIQNVKAALDQILKEKDEFSFLPTDHHPPLPKPPPRVQSTSFIQLDKVHGVEIDKNKNDIVNKLMILVNNGTDHIHSSQIQILSIVGMGGIGKTTLAQLVYNDARVNDWFDLRIWICVSDPFDVAVIARGIVNSVGNETIPRDTDQLELILQKLRDCISGKKFLLVLDDVWTEEYKEWEPLKINLNYGAPTSKILVTTRNERVANMMMRDNVHVEIYRPQKLSDEDCWKLLRRISLSKEECGNFEDVGKNIAKKCKGLPLAAKVLGSLLQYKNSMEEWENILESEIWQMEEAEVELFPHLLLSYNELSPPLKRCFSYCAVYPKDSYILSERLIEEWMALGYLGITDAGLELKGRDYFNNLAMRSLFQDFTKSYSGEQIAWCKMHDIVHSFAQFVRKSNDRVGAAEISKRRSCSQASCDHILVSQVQEYRSLFWDKETPPNLCDCLTSLRVLRFQRILNATPKGMGNLIHLRWLELSGTTLSNEDLNIICSLYFLQTLLLASCSLREIPEEIGNLVELRHLNLHSNKELRELPGSICNLVELQILNIERCRNLNQLPEGIHMLLNLQHLLIEETTVSGHFPRGLASLSGLRTLGSFHGGSGWSKLGLLKNLNRLTGSLKLEIHVSGMEDLQELIEEAREAGLRNKIHIQTLDIQFKYEKAWWSLPSVGMEVIEALEPNDNLKILRIEGYKGSKLPHWISSPLNLVKEINLIGLSEVSSLPPLGKLPHLEALKMQGQYKLKLVGKEFLGILECSSTSASNNDDVVDNVAFPKLKKLVFEECSDWSEWEDVEEDTAVAIMPCLKELDVKLCVRLKKLPHCLLRNAFCLEILNIKYSSELIKSYRDEDGPNWRAISQNNPKLQLRIV